jgi:hypothetical protein
MELNIVIVAADTVDVIPVPPAETTADKYVCASVVPGATPLGVGVFVGVCVCVGVDVTCGVPLCV